jgi:hypothetical protein
MPNGQRAPVESPNLASVLESRDGSRQPGLPFRPKSSKEAHGQPGGNSWLRPARRAFARDTDYRDMPFGRERCLGS